MRKVVMVILVLEIALSGRPCWAQGGILGRAARQAARWVGRPLEGKTARVLTRTGEAATVARIRPGRVAAPWLTHWGPPAAKAMAVLGPRQARRLAILAETGELARIGRTHAVLAVVERFGDRALDFVWRHKAALAVAAVLSAFLADPQPFLDGGRDLAGVATTAVLQPLTQIPGRVAVALAPSWPGTTIVLTALTGLGLLALSQHHRRRVRRSRPLPHSSQGPLS